ncbi:MAG: S-layer glycoprotein N-glycosyltransferase AglJ, partial [Archaeoglobi archaeon]|nr:S-layer glycoprotein N-glycosyltransferase AglJ [Candidatus Mnemosynella sp.]
AETIGELVRRFRELGFSDILVIDGGSTDGTREIASREGARVVLQKGRGKGSAIIQALEMIDKEITLMIDGDGTYLPEDAFRLIEEVRKGADHVIGNRFADYERGSFTLLNIFGNRILNILFSAGYGLPLNDILSGYRAFRTEKIRELNLKQSGFEIEAEMTIESLRNGLKVVEVPISYRRRKGKTKLNPVRDGVKIGLTIYRMMKMHNPLMYFGFLGIFMMILGVISGVYVVVEWTKGITHSLLSILTALFIITGFQIFMFGVISDLIVSLHRELMRELRRLK